VRISTSGAIISGSGFEITFGAPGPPGTEIGEGLPFVALSPSGGVIGWYTLSLQNVVYPMYGVGVHPF
jgi:hypothetical protein